MKNAPHKGRTFHRPGGNAGHARRFTAGIILFNLAKPRSNIEAAFEKIPMTIIL